MKPPAKMHVTMVKKLLEGGRACDKCVHAEQLLKSRGLWANIHQVVWAIDGDPQSPGMVIAARKGVEAAPFFIVRDDSGSERVYESVLRFVKDCLTQVAHQTNQRSSQPLSASEFSEIGARLAGLSPPKSSSGHSNALKLIVRSHLAGHTT